MTSFNIVLVHPDIPHNTGAIGRLCLATKTTLHLVKPIGFDLDEKAVRRSGLDYWQDVDIELWESIDDLFEKIHAENANFYLYTTKTDQVYWETEHRPGDYLIFGSETRGLPEPFLDRFPENQRTIPIVKEHVRSLNLANAASIVLYEGLRQIYPK